MRILINLAILLGVPGTLTALSYFVVPKLFSHGSSAAFNAGCLLSVLTFAAWAGAYYLVFGGRK